MPRYRKSPAPEATRQRPPNHHNATSGQTVLTDERPPDRRPRDREGTFAPRPSDSPQPRLRQLERAFLEEGGFTERLYRERKKRQ